eukprot:2091674-Prymnesium_polylepis.1
MPRYLLKLPKFPCDTRLVTWVAASRQSYGCGIRPRPVIKVRDCREGVDWVEEEQPPSARSES